MSSPRLTSADMEEQTEASTPVTSREEELPTNNVQSGMTDSDIEEAEAEMDKILGDLVRSTTSADVEEQLETNALVRSREEEFPRNNVHSGMTDSDIKEAEAEMDKILGHLVRSTNRAEMEKEQTRANTPVKSREEELPTNNAQSPGAIGSPEKEAPVRSREEELPTEDAEAVMDRLVEHHHSLMIVEQRKADSPHNRFVCSIPTEKMQPLVVSFWDRVATVDISDRDSKRLLADMFVEIIATLSSLILDAFRDITLSGRNTQLSLLVSEESVHKALHKTLCESFKAVLGSIHRSMNELFKMVTSEVASRVNSVLSCSKVQDNHLVVTGKNEYKTQRDKIRAMVRYARAMLQSIKGLISQCYGQCGCPNQLEEYREDLELTPTDAASQPLVEEEQEKGPKTIQGQLRKSCPPSGSLVHFEEEEGMPASRSTDKNYHKLASLTPGLKAATEAVKKILEKEASMLEIFRVDQLTIKDQAVLLKSLSDDNEDIAASIIAIIIDEMDSIRSDSSKGSEMASAAQDGPTKTPCLQGLDQKIKYFVLLYFTKANFHSLLTKLCCQKTACRTGSLEMVLEKASPILKELVSGQATDSQGREVCIFERLYQALTNGQYQDFRQPLRNVILKYMMPQKTQSKFKREVRQHVNTFMVNILRWVILQQQLHTDRRNQVQGALQRIYRLAMATPPSKMCKSISPLKSPNQPMTTYPEGFPSTVSVAQRLKAEDEALLETIQKVPTATLQKVPMATVQKVAASTGQEVPMAQSKYQWDTHHFSGLVYEIAILVFQKKQGPDFEELCMSLELLLEPKITEWDIQVKPWHIKKVAKAVFSDLYHGRKKEYVQKDTYTKPDFNTIVMNSIYKHLVMPQKTSRFSSFLQSVRKVCCLPCRAR